MVDMIRSVKVPAPTSFEPRRLIHSLLEAIPTPLQAIALAVAAAPLTTLIQSVIPLLLAVLSVILGD